LSLPDCIFLPFPPPKKMKSKLVGRPEGEDPEILGIAGRIIIE